MIGMMKYWIGEVGIDGFRCDDAGVVPTDFWEHARSELDKIKPVMLLAEGTLPEYHQEAFDLTYSWTMYDALGSVMNGTGRTRVFSDLEQIEKNQFPRGSIRLRFITNHQKNVDDGTAVSRYSPKGARTSAVLTYTFPGVPLLHNGEEVGSEKKLSSIDKVDIDWTTNLGFRAFYQVLGELRSSHQALRRGEFIPVRNSRGSNVMSFLRRSGADMVLVVLNLSTEPGPCEIDVSTLQNTDFFEYFSKTHFLTTNGRLMLGMKSLDYMVFLPTTGADKP
jgi:glycosidase